MSDIKNVLSLFDGISVAQQALTELNINFENYYASETDKYAIAITKYNFPNTIQLGDIRNINIEELPKIDLIIGGFPCPSWSKAGLGKGFNDQRGQLFFDFVEIIKKVQPKYFIAENVNMKKEFCDQLNYYLGVKPILINSSLVSAQNRERNYWANFQISQPVERGIVLNNILEKGVISDRNKSYCIDANYFKGGNLSQYFHKKRRQIVFKCNHIGEADIKGIESLRRVYDPNGKCPTLTTSQGGHREPKVLVSETEWRKLTPLECERCQTLPDFYTKFGYESKTNKFIKISNTQRYKTLGNSFTKEVIIHILKHIMV